MSRGARNARLGPVKYAYCAVRWFAHEFLGIGGMGEHHPILSASVRLLGCLTTYIILRVELRNGVTTDVLSALSYLSLAGLSAVFIGHSAREMGFCLCRALVNTTGRVFCRCGLTLNGSTFHEAHYPDGTWMRCESRERSTICEWTDPLGRCHRIEVRPRRQEPRPTHGRAPAILSWKPVRSCTRWTKLT